MGIRFRKSFKAAPGVKVNLNKKSVGVTLGTKGAHYSINSKGKRTATVGIPGTGLSYTTTSGGRKKSAGQKPSKKAAFSKAAGILIAVVAICCAAGAIKSALDKKAETAAASVTQSAAVLAAEEIPASPSADTAAEEIPASPSADTAAQDMVWISGSGKKYHRTPDCSGMENAEEISLQDAQDMGREPCKRCNP